MFYILHGEEEFGRAEELGRIRDGWEQEEPGLTNLNTTVLEGKGLTLGELRHHCDSIPFMAKRRMVIVQGLLGWLVKRSKGKEQEGGDEAPVWKRAYLKDLVGYLPYLPETTRLFFVETVTLKPSHPIVKLAGREGGDKARIRPFRAPKDDELPGWVQRRARHKKGAFDREAALPAGNLGGSGPETP